MTRSRHFSVDWGVPGLAGTLAVTVLATNHSLLVNRTTTGVTPIITGSGIYDVTISNFDDSWEGTILWDDGTNEASEAFGAPLVVGSVQVNVKETDVNVSEA
jgi:hypothetical protein